MGKMMYECECGFRVDGRHSQAIEEHESKCEVAIQDEEFEEVFPLASYLLGDKRSESRIKQVSENLVSFDQTLMQYYEDMEIEEDNVSVLLSALAVYMFDHILEQQDEIKPQGNPTKKVENKKEEKPMNKKVENKMEEIVEGVKKNTPPNDHFKGISN